MVAKFSPAIGKKSNLLSFIQFGGQALNCRKSACLLIFIFYSLAGYSRLVFDTSIRPADARPEAYLPLLKNKRIALIINQTSRVGDLSLLDLLLSRHINVKMIFVPEHGFRGNEDAGAKVENTVDSATNIPIVSLYGNHKKPQQEDLADIDVVVYDLQDVGVRFYTYISTMEYCMEACAQGHKQFIVLDRPNPNGFYVDGPVLEKENSSFVGMQPIPVVYGMTAGEYAAMLAGERWFAHAGDLDLKVIRCINYDHSKKYQLPVAPSPNLPNMAAVYAYPSLCLFEGAPISVGRGTDRPFQLYGCPEFEGKFTFAFTPHSGKGAKHPPYEDKQCFGEVIGNTETEVLEKIDNRFQLTWLIRAYQAYPAKDKFFNSFFIRLSGTGKLEEQIKSGDSEAEIRQTWIANINSFNKIRKKYLLYSDF
jgi:uncharacterized protein YbbC (DUF1343 family)